MDYGQLKTDIFQAAVAETTPELTPEDMDITYYATAKTGSVGDMGKTGRLLAAAKYPVCNTRRSLPASIRFVFPGAETALMRLSRQRPRSRSTTGRKLLMYEESPPTM